MKDTTKSTPLPSDHISSPCRSPVYIYRPPEMPDSIPLLPALLSAVVVAMGLLMWKRPSPAVTAGFEMKDSITLPLTGNHLGTGWNETQTSGHPVELFALRHERPH